MVRNIFWKRMILLPSHSTYLKLFITYWIKWIQFRTESKCFLKNTTKTQGEHNDAKKNPLKNPVKHIKITRFTKAKHRSIIHRAILWNLKKNFGKMQLHKHQNKPSKTISIHFAALFVMSMYTVRGISYREYFKSVEIWFQS